MTNIKENKIGAKQLSIADNFDIEAHITECDISYRGGNLKVDVSSIFPDVEDAIMGAYQNYLGGGIAGAIIGASMFTPDDLTADQQEVFYALKERIKKYFYAINQGGGDDYMVENVNSYDKNQIMPTSGY